MSNSRHDTDARIFDSDDNYNDTQQRFVVKDLVIY